MILVEEDQDLDQVIEEEGTTVIEMVIELEDLDQDHHLEVVTTINQEEVVEEDTPDLTQEEREELAAAEAMREEETETEEPALPEIIRIIALIVEEATLQETR